MERTIVIYKGKYGSTDKYAGWIGQELECPVKELSQIKRKDLENYDNIIYGGGVHAGGIRGWDVFKKWVQPILKMDYYGKLGNPDYIPSKKLVIFTVGVNVRSFDTRSQLRDVNFDKKWLRGLTCYFLPGAYDPAKVKGIDKMIMGFMIRMLKDKGLNMDPDERLLLQRVEEGCDLVDRNTIENIVKEFKGQ